MLLIPTYGVFFGGELKDMCLDSISVKTAIRGTGRNPSIHYNRPLSLHSTGTLTSAIDSRS